MNCEHGKAIKQALTFAPIRVAALDPPRPRPLLLPLMYIPFASLLGLQALLEPFAHKQPAPEVAFIDGVDFVDPRPGGGSLLDHDSGGLGEPLNVSFSPPFSFPP
jgi:hypothetical protein